MVIVLGDVARSPRMCYHIQSLVRHGWDVHVAGYFDTTLPASLQGPQVHPVRLWTPPPCLQALPRALFVLVALVKVPMQAGSLFHAIVRSTPRPALVVVQTPPAIPTLGMVRLACAWTRSRILIDWHNTAYTILALKVGPRSLLVRLAEQLERWCGQRATTHLFVTYAMRHHLVQRWHLQGETLVLHDRPPSHFHRLTQEDAHTFLQRVGPSIWGTMEPMDPTAALVVSSTSWTPDEDLGMLIDAVSQYEAQARRRPSTRPLRVVITGRGPQRSMYERLMAQRSAQEAWRYVSIHTAWLAAEDYPRLLGAADVGVSLHTSSSGLDLPMKVVDMLGCGVPVCALGFACLHELIEPGVNGAVFHTADELATCLLHTLHTPRTTHGGFLGTEPATWDALWDQVVASSAALQ
ncbi:beta- -mannosyltransferase [Malassezia pachydermatis]|uniref:Chitobiosyldiphosphodolichol beta-mannosyltransferase n=1 Tax=Malassezia pachydermatis TaxID=77020 RepID=A0A0M8MWP3_9BASI|nr:beta- -mannosyltransferase [Malassezia pachydermatis]KOS15300.1 beta- -mannosyltransferase [Malassezia pachydermatis]